MPRRSSVALQPGWTLGAAPARWIEIGTLALLTTLLPLTPLLWAALARDSRYLRRYREAVLASWVMLQTMAATGVVARGLLRRWGPQAEPAARIEGHCSHCGRCCIHQRCVFLSFDALGRSACRIHGSRFWRLTGCGAYPIDAADIALYACPTFTAIPIRRG